MTRTLLKLYPRTIRDRYGSELLDLQDELAERDQLSRARLICDMVAGAVTLRLAHRRVPMMVAGPALIAAIIAAALHIASTGSPTPHRPVALVAQTVPAAPNTTCEVAGGTPCSAPPCAEFIAQFSTGTGVTPARRSAASHSQVKLGSRCPATARPTSQSNMTVTAPATTP